MEELGQELDLATKKLNKVERLCKDLEFFFAEQEGHIRNEFLQKWNSCVKEADKWRSICATIHMKQEPFFKAFKFHVEDSSKL